MSSSWVAKGKTYIVAEVAQAHDGSLGMAHAYIDAIANTGADAVKFQTHIAAAESTVGEGSTFGVDLPVTESPRGLPSFGT